MFLWSENEINPSSYSGSHKWHLLSGMLWLESRKWAQLEKCHFFYYLPLNIKNFGSDLPKISNVIAYNKIQNLSSMIFWRKWQLTPVFLPGESPGQRTLGVYGVARVGHNWATKRTHTVWFEESEITGLKKLQTWQYTYFYLLHLVFIFQIFVMLGLGKEKINTPQFFSKFIVW